MTFIIVLTAITAIAILGPRFGTDSRRLTDHAPTRDAHWSR